MPEVRGDGSVIQLDKTKKTSEKQAWELRVSVGYDRASKSYKPMTQRFHGTLTQAKKALRKFIVEIESDEIQRRSNMKFDDYCDAWLDERKNKVSELTVHKDRYRLESFKMHLGNEKLSKITPQALEDVYSRLMNGESPSGKNLSPNTVAGNATTLHRMFHDAVKAGHLTTNPCDYAERPRTDVKERNSIRAGDIKDLVKKLDATHPSQLVLIIALKTGMRRGEIHGLSWGDVDFDKREIHIVRSYTDLGTLKQPKTSKGYRTIPMPESLLADLNARLNYQIKKLEDWGADYGVSSDSPIISDDLLVRELPHSSTRWWTRNRGSLGYPDLTIHEMRHSYLSEMARRDISPKVLQTLAGHAKYSTTMDIYTHVDMEDKHEAMRVVDW